LLLFYSLISACNKPEASSNREFTIQKNKYAQHFSLGKTTQNQSVAVVNNLWNSTSHNTEHYLLLSDTITEPGKKNLFQLKTPLRRVVCMSASHVAQLAEINQTSCIVGVSGAEYIYHAETQKRYKNGEISSFPDAANMNIEELTKLNPDAVFMVGVQASDMQIAEKIRSIGIPVIFNNDYLEQNPLGRAEWTIFMATFFDMEKQAREKFDSIEKRYLQIKNKISNNQIKPLIFLNIPFKDVWYMPGGNSYFAQLIADAGGKYVFENDLSKKSLALDFEYVFAHCAQADFWLNAGNISRLDDLKNADMRFIHFGAWQTKKVFSPIKRMEISGANDFWEKGVTHPYLLLSDLHAIFSGDYQELYFYSALE